MGHRSRRTKAMSAEAIRADKLGARTPGAYGQKSRSTDHGPRPQENEARALRILKSSTDQMPIPLYEGVELQILLHGSVVGLEISIHGYQKHAGASPPLRIGRSPRDRNNHWIRPREGHDPSMGEAGI